MVTEGISDLYSSSGTTTLTSTNADDVSQTDFLMLLVAQLQNQDPLNPTENQEFVAELATFSSLEQQQNQTALLEDILEAQSNSTSSQALSLIGKDVKATVDSFYFAEGDALDFSFPAEAGQVVIQIANESGRVVATQTMNIAEAGMQDYTFYGVGDNGEFLSSGNYTIEVGTPIDEDGNIEASSVFLSGNVEAVSFADGYPILTVSGQYVDMSQIFSVLMPEDEPAD